MMEIEHPSDSKCPMYPVIEGNPIFTMIPRTENYFEDRLSNLNLKPNQQADPQKQQNISKIH